MPPAEGGVAPWPAEDGGTRPRPGSDGGPTGGTDSGTRPGLGSDGGLTGAGDGGTRPGLGRDGGLTGASDSGIRSAPARNDDITLRPPRDPGLPPALAAGGGFSPPSAGNNRFTLPPAGSGFTPPQAGNGPASPAPRGGPDADPLEDEHFVPPPPPPLPRLSPVQKGAWVALFGGPGYLLAATLAGWSVAGWLAIAAIAAFVGGFMTLVLHLGDDRDRDSGSDDDGAVI